MSHHSNARLAPLEMKLRESPVPWGGVGSVDNANPLLCPAEGGSSPPSLLLYFTPAHLCAPRAMLSHGVHQQQLGHRSFSPHFCPGRCSLLGWNPLLALTSDSVSRGLCLLQVGMPQSLLLSSSPSLKTSQGFGHLAAGVALLLLDESFGVYALCAWAVCPA